MNTNGFNLADFLPYQLSVASNAVSQRIARVYQDEFGLKVSEWRVMAMLGDRGIQTQRELTKRTLMDKVAVNRACKSLEKRGFAERVPNRNDGRSHHLDLSQKGRAAYDTIIPLAKSAEQDLLALMTQDQQRLFRDLLKRMHEYAG